MDNQEENSQQSKSEKIFSDLPTFVASSVPASIDQTRYDVADFSIFKVGDEPQKVELKAAEAKALDMSNPDDFIIGAPATQNYVDLDFDHFGQSPSSVKANAPVTTELFATDKSAEMETTIEINTTNASSLLDYDEHNTPTPLQSEKHQLPSGGNETFADVTNLMDTSTIDKLLSDLPEETDEEDEGNSPNKSDSQDWYSQSDFKEEIVTSANVAFASQAEAVMLPASSAAVDLPLLQEVHSETLPADISRAQSNTDSKDMSLDDSLEVSEPAITNSASEQQQMFTSNGEDFFAGNSSSSNLEQNSNNKLVDDSLIGSSMSSPPLPPPLSSSYTDIDTDQMVVEETKCSFDEQSKASAEGADNNAADSAHSNEESSGATVVSEPVVSAKLQDYLASAPLATSLVQPAAVVRPLTSPPPPPPSAQSIILNRQEEEKQTTISADESLLFLGSKDKSSSPANLNLHTSASSDLVDEQQVLSSSSAQSAPSTATLLQSALLEEEDQVDQLEEKVAEVDNSFKSTSETTYQSPVSYSHYEALEEVKEEDLAEGTSSSPAPEKEEELLSKLAAAAVPATGEAAFSSSSNLPPAAASVNTRLQSSSSPVTPSVAPDTASAPPSTSTTSSTMGRKNQSYRRENSSDEAEYSGPDQVKEYIENVLGPNVAELVYWRDPKNSGVVFGIGFVILLSLSIFSVINVEEYTLFFTLLGTLSFRIYKNVMQAVQKTGDGHPFREYLEIEIVPPQERINEVVDSLVTHGTCFVNRIRSVLLVEDIVDSLKYLLIFWGLTYIGAWFNGITLVILAYIFAFSLPKVYEQNKEQIDQYLNLVNSKISEITDKVPFLKKVPAEKEE